MASCHHTGGFGSSLSCSLCLAELAAVVPSERGRARAPKRRLHLVPADPGPKYRAGPEGDPRWPEEARKHLDERERAAWRRVYERLWNPEDEPDGAA